jgi:hypothetical protein
MSPLRFPLVLAVIVFWLLAALAEIATLHFDPTRPAAALTPHTWGKHLGLAAFWIAATLATLRHYAARPLRLAHWRRQALPASLVAAGLTALYVAWVGLLIAALSGLRVSWREGVGMMWSPDLLYSWFKSGEVVLVVNGYLYVRRIEAQAREREQLQLRLVETELTHLRAQLEPHFLFNALNSIVALMRLGRNAPSIAALEQLALLLRGVLEVGQRATMPWPWELEFSRRYVALQALRFGDRLQVRFDVDAMRDGDPFPAMLLQPLIENAIHHGRLDDGETCETRVEVGMHAGRLRIVVRNAIGCHGTHPGRGVGLSNLRARLEANHGDAVGFTQGRIGDDFEVRIELPSARAMEAVTS